jgi:hypothetical protein
MSQDSVRSSVIGGLDRIAAWRQAIQTNSSGGTLLWARVDASGDVDYENTVKGTDVAAVDTAMTTGATGVTVGNWFSRHQDYFSVTSVANMDAYLSANGARAHEYAAACYTDKYATNLTARNVFPATSRTVATYLFSGVNVFSPAPAYASATYGATMVEAYVAAVTSPAAVFSITYDSQFGSAGYYKTLLTLTAAGVGSTFTVGAQTIVSAVVTGAANFYVASTGLFTAGDYVGIKGPAQIEFRTIGCVVANTYVQVTSPTVFAWPLTSAPTLVPAFFRIASVTQASGGTAGDALTFRPQNDRTIAL